jgi:YidC/Oxa1 family membrane protein insertase
MNKKDLVPVILLALLIPAYMMVDRHFIAPRFADKTTAPPVEQTTITPSTTDDAPVQAEIKPIAAPETVTTPEKSEVPAEEIISELNNGKLHIELTSLGAGIKSVTLVDKDESGEFLYPELNEKQSPPVLIDFTGSAALAYEGIAGIGIKDSLAGKLSEDGNSIIFSKSLESGLLFERTLTIGDDYLLTVSDRFANKGTAPLSIPSARILTGRMKNPTDMKATKGISILGVDSFTAGGGVNYWGKKLNKLFKNANKAATIDAVPEDMSSVAVDWVSAKNKFFTQIINPEDTTVTMSVLSSRDTSEKAILPIDIAAALNYQPTVINPGETRTLNYSYFIGPKNYSILKASGNSMEKVMEFETTGFFSFMNWLMEPSRRFLLWTLNLFHGVVQNYGIAIILLTLLIRIMFWPLTHKSTESMKRMQEAQPQIKAIQEKYKKDPQRAQQEVMAFYKENKINPMGGCLPMFVQIPVFIALFTVLRNAIELRYSGFLWIADLSQPENLFAGSIPFIGSLNILPLVMSVSMIWQQKLSTPGTAVTPEQQQQQKMMMYMMPIMMLFFFYTMPSGLVLYWTTSNLLMIAQTSIRNVRKKKAEA